MWRVLGKIGTFIRGAVPLIKEGVFSSIAENRVWITLYIPITGLFLMSQSILQSTPLYIQVFAILLLIIALGTIYWLHRSPSLPQVFALCIITGFQPVVLITVSQFTIFDILIGPVVTWLIAIALAMSFTIIGRAFSF